MNAAAVLALCAAMLQLGMGLLLVGLARAPGWRSARTFAMLALTASAYSAANMFFALPSLDDSAVLYASRVNFFAASLHFAAWLLYTFGGPTASARVLPKSLKALALVLVGTGVFILVTGLHYIPGVWADSTIAWANVSYRSPTLRPWAEWYGLVLVGALLLPFSAFVKRARAGEPGAIPHLLGFGVFFACSVVEMLVASRVVETFYLADVGFLAVVVPVAIATVRRVVQDAGRLDALSQKLAGEVEERTEALDRAQVALLESERHAALGRLAAGVGHEINNPLTYLGLSLSTVETWASRTTLPSDVRDAIVSARDGTDRIRQVVDGLRNYTRSTAGEDRALSPADLIQTAFRVASHQLQHVARIQTDLPSTAPVLGDEARLVQVLVNLLTNSAQAIAESGRSGDVTITVRARELADGFVAMEVVDTGPGISPENLRRLAQPYFTTRADTGGTGLGLYLARGIVEQHGGRLEIESEFGRGTTARVVLPAAQRQADEKVAPLPTRQVRFGGARPHILIVDDEPMLARGLARALSPFCDVMVAHSGKEAMTRVTDATTELDAVVCDVMMPGMNGIEFADALQECAPALRERTLFMTGGAVTPAAIEFLDRPDVQFVHKPIDGSELADAIARLLSPS